MNNIEITFTTEMKQKLRDIAAFTILAMWMFIPIMMSFKIFFYANIQIYYGIMTLAGIVGIVLAGINIYEEIKNSPNKKKAIVKLLPIVIFFAFMMWTLLSSCMSSNKMKAFLGNARRNEGFFTYISYAGFFFCSFAIKNEKIKRTVLNIFIISAVFLLISSLILRPIDLKYTKIMTNNLHYQTIFQQFTHYGYFLLIATVCCLSLFITEKNKFLKVVYFLIYIVLTHRVIYNDTFASYLSLLIILILYTVYSIIKKKDRKKILLLLLVFIILSCVVTKRGEYLAYKNFAELGNDLNTIVCKLTQKGNEENVEDKEIEEAFLKTGTDRMRLWTTALTIIKEKPILGYGPDNLGDEYSKRDVAQDRAHNFLLQLSVTSGIPGMLLYVTAVGIIVISGIIKLFQKDSNIKIYLMLVIAHLISAMFSVSMYYVTPYFFIFLGGLMRYNSVDK